MSQTAVCHFFTQPSDRVQPTSRSGHSMIAAGPEGVNTLYSSSDPASLHAEQLRFVGPWIWRYIIFSNYYDPSVVHPYSVRVARSRAANRAHATGGVVWELLSDGSRRAAPQFGDWSYTLGRGLHR